MKSVNVDTLTKHDRILYLALANGPGEEIEYYTGQEAFETNQFRGECSPELWDGIDPEDRPVRKDYRSGWYRNEEGPYHPALLEYLSANRIMAIRFAARMWGFEYDDPDTLRAAGLD